MSIKAVGETNEIFFHIFDPTESIYYDPTGKFTVKSYSVNKYILVSYH